MRSIGLTGGIASGKSTVVEALRELGAETIDADRLGHQTYEPGTGTFKAVVAAFGDELVAGDGTIDRRVLGGKVFGKPDELKRLTDIVWPGIRALAAAELERLAEAGTAVAVLEAAVLIEAEWQDLRRRGLGRLGRARGGAGPADGAQRHERGRRGRPHRLADLQPGAAGPRRRRDRDRLPDRRGARPGRGRLERTQRAHRLRRARTRERGEPDDHCRHHRRGRADHRVPLLGGRGVPLEEEPYYVAVGDEIDIFEAAWRSKIPVLLKGPTGCGKTRFVEHMAYRLNRPLAVVRDGKREIETESNLPLVTVACHEDLTASDLVGRYLLEGNETVWIDGR